MRSVIFASLASLAYRNVHVHAHPHPSGFSQSERMLSRRAVNLDAFRMVLETDYTNATEVNADPNLAPASLVAENPADTATELVKSTVPDATFRLTNGQYTGNNGITHLHFRQTANGLDIDNADFNVNIGRDGKIFSFGNSFYKGPAPSPLRKRATVAPVDALKAAVSQLQLPITTDKAVADEKSENTFTIKATTGTVSDPEARLVYVNVDGKLSLSWRLETDIDSDWLVTYLDAQSGEKIHHVINYAADASYQVYPWGLNDPTEGERIVITDPFDPVSSEFGWHSDGTETYNSTQGNNAVAQSNWNNRPTSELLAQPRPVPENLKFEYPFSLDETDWKSYINASITQLYYTSNIYHDLLYQLGFTEAAGNFEKNNNGQGGLENDFVFLNAQDGAGVNNANMLIVPDGTRGRMRMYMWNNTTPWRDGSFDAGIVIHEYTHGLSTRLTGGPSNPNCLGTTEAGGMGEGWGDFMSLAIRLKPSDTRAKNYGVGVWAKGNDIGVRRYLYSTDLTTNPLTYSNADGDGAVHSVGTIWSTILYEVLWNLIDKHGKNDGDKPVFDDNGVPTDGKYLAMKLVVDGMALQPCNPNFVSARDAIIDADRALTGGANACELWTGFAKRGLGQGAVYSTTRRTQSFTVPPAACA